MLQPVSNNEKNAIYSQKQNYAKESTMQQNESSKEMNVGTLNNQTGLPSTKMINHANKDESATKTANFGKHKCLTCAERTYQDVSNDPGVSFKTPTKLTPAQASSAVMAHEQEHVSNSKSEAAREDKEIINQSVSLHMGICPECGKAYVAGGTTRTTTASKDVDKFTVGLKDYGGNIVDESV